MQKIIIHSGYFPRFHTDVYFYVQQRFQKIFRFLLANYSYPLPIGNYKKLQIRPKYFPQFHFSLFAASTEKICSRLYSALIVYWSLQKYLKVGKYFKSPPIFGAHTLISFFYSKQESNGLYHHKKQNNWKDFLCKKCCWFFPISVQ